MSRLCIIPARALADEELSSRDLRALLAIGKFASRDGSGVWASRETIASEARLDEADYRRSLRRLVDRGYVRKEERTRADGGSSTAMLSVILDDPPQLELGEGGGRIAPPGSEGAVPPGGELPPRGPVPPGREGAAPPQTNPINTTASPPPPRELANEFVHEAHREAYLALRRGHRLPVAFDAGLRDVHAPINGGPGFAWEIIGAALLQLQANGETFNAARIRGYCRLELAGHPVRRPTNGPPGEVAIGTMRLTPDAFWSLCVDAGLTAPMLNRGMLDDAVSRLTTQGRVTDPPAFVACVLAVNPASLAEIKFAKTREERLTERLQAFARRAA